MPDLIDLDRNDEIAILRLRGGRANAMSPALLDALTRTVDRLMVSDARAAVIIGEGAAFSAGLALPDLIDLDRPAMTTFIDDFATAMRRVLECPVPVVAAINGHAIAGGCVLALTCDARIAAAATPERTPRIGLSEVQLGIGLPAVVLEPLRLRVPPTSLTAIALEGTLFAPEDARRVGLVDEVVEGASLEARAIGRARALGHAPRAAYAQVKRALVRPAVEAMERAGIAEREAWLDTWFSPPAQQLLRSAVEKISKRP